MKAKKDNKVYDISEIQKKLYLSEGYDIYDDDGKIISYSPLKKVGYDKYMELKEANKKLDAKIKELSELNVDGLNKQIQELTEQIENLTKINAELTKSNAELTEANKKLTEELKKAKK